MSLIHYLQLSFTAGVGPITARKMIEHFGSIGRACAAKASELREIEGVGTRNGEKIGAGLVEGARRAEAELRKATAAGVSILCPTDDAYPVLLKEIPDPPLVLYMRGTLEPRDLHSVAIVGSRKCSFYGREQAERFAALLSAAGVTVISGGARGIDSVAHRGAMQHPAGRTIAVLGSGVDVAYPPENKTLFDDIAARGAVLSEYPLGTTPSAENFPRRNRIVSGMSRGVLVIEADERSGALITARQACDDHGRPVFALPGRVDSPQSAGPHKLIRDGAILTTKLEDILDELGPLPHSAVEPPPAPVSQETAGLFDHQNPLPTAISSPPVDATLMTLSESQRSIFSCLDGQAVGVDTIIERTDLDASVVLRDLTLLTLRGVVRRVDGQTFAKR